MQAMIAAVDAPLKLVIAGNHDLTLDQEYYARVIKERKRHRGIPEDVEAVKEIWTGEEAQAAGIVYLEEGVRSFELENGAGLTVGRGPCSFQCHVFWTS